MLQILLAVIGMTMAGAVGFAMLEQTNMQQQMQVSREDNRRMDAAAESLTRNLVQMPSFNILMAPANVAGSTYSVLPSNLNAQQVNSQGVPFLYCPLATTSQAAIPTDAATSVTNGSVVQGDGTSYATRNYLGAITSDSASIDTSVRTIGPVAVITSAAKGITVPPPCSAVKMVNGRATVPNGLARVITIPTVGKSNRQAQAASVSYYISQAGSGDYSGKDSSNTAIAAETWKAISQSRPATAKVNLVGTIDDTASNNFLTYVSNGGMKNTHLIMNGGVFNTPNDFLITSKVTVQGTELHAWSIQLDDGGELNLTGTVRLFPIPGHNRGYMVQAAIGTTLNLTNADFQALFSGNSGQMIANYGRVNVLNSYVTYTGAPDTPAATVNNYIINNSTGYVMIDNSVIGRSPTFGLVRAVYNTLDNGPGGIYVTTSSAIIIRTSATSTCGADFNNGAAFEYASGTPNTTVSIPAESTYTPPLSTDTEVNKAAFATQAAIRRRGREEFPGQFYCSET